MRETERSTLAIVMDMLTRNPRKIWQASCEICSLSQNHRRIMRFAPLKPFMGICTRHVDLKGTIAPNSRFLVRAFKIIDFHKRGKGCPCCLLGEDSNPCHVVEDGYFELLETVYWEGHPSVVNYFIVRCRQCGTVYKVEELEYHYTWWKWTCL